MSRIETQDATLKEVNGVFDIQIDDEGDILTQDFFDTSLQMSIFCEQRALESEMGPSHLRRGWIGNLETVDTGFEIGSKLWLLYQARKRTKTLNGIITATSNALQWLVDGEFIVDYQVTPIINSEGGAVLVEIFRSASESQSILFQLWDNTGQN